MFVEITEDAWKKFKPYLDENKYGYEVSDATLQKDSIKHIHIEFEDMDKERTIELARQLDIVYESVAKASRD